MRYGVLCLSIGAVIGEVVGTFSNFAHQTGVAGALQIGAIGILLGSLLGALFSFLTAFVGRYLYGPAIRFWTLAGALCGLIVALTSFVLPTAILSALVGLVVGALSAYFLCRFCRTRHRFTH